jgi:hypothetical protein
MKHSSHFRWVKKGTNGRVAETRPQFHARRFWGKVEKTDGCWLWTAGVRRNHDQCNAYGQFFFDGRNVSAHRMSLMLAGVVLGEHDVVAHRCDNPRCVNPDHLFVTTNQGNTADREAKGRGAKRERNGNASLSDADVERIREAALFGARRSDLVSVWGISRTHLWRLLTNKMRQAARHGS